MHGARRAVRYLVRGRRIHAGRQRAGGYLRAVRYVPDRVGPAHRGRPGPRCVHVHGRRATPGRHLSGGRCRERQQGRARPERRECRRCPDTHRAALSRARDRARPGLCPRRGTPGSLRRDRDRHRLRIRTCGPHLGRRWLGRGVPHRPGGRQRSVQRAHRSLAAGTRESHQGSRHPDLPAGGGFGCERPAARPERHRERPTPGRPGLVPGALPPDGDTRHDPRPGM